MLADQLAAAVNQLLCAFLLQSLVIPAAGEGHVHGDSGADGLGTQIEGSVTGNNLGIGESTDITHLGLVSGKLTGLDHLIELHTGSNTGQVTTLIDGSKSVVVVSQTLGVSAGAGRVAELDIGILLGGVDHVRLMTEAVGEDDVAAVVDQVASGLIAFLALGDIGLQDIVILGQTQVGNGLFRAIDEVEVVSGVLIMQGDEAHLDLSTIGFVGILTAGHQAQSHNQSENQCKKLFHACLFLLLYFDIRRKKKEFPDT